MTSVSHRRYDQMENIAPRESQTRRKGLKYNAEPNTQNRKQESDMSTREFGEVKLRHKHGNSRAKSGSAGRDKEDGVEHLLSVHDNPFIKEFGLESAMHHENRDILEADVRTNDVENSTETEPLQEYHVNSGFVNKLRSRFELDTQGSSRLTHSKRSASVENLLSLGSSSSSKSRSRIGSANRCSADDSRIISRSQPDFNKYGQLGLKTTEQTGSKLPLTRKPDFNKYGVLGLKTNERPKSNELVFKSTDKPIIGKPKIVDNFLTHNKPLLPAGNKSLSDSVTNKHKKYSEPESAMPPEHHDWIVAPDLQKLGRDNLVIIEAVPPAPRLTDGENRTDESESRQIRSMKVKTDENELPKANTVSAFRSMFENSKKLPTAVTMVTAWQPRSPTTRGPASETNSPRPLSGDSLPSSPLVTSATKADDNVFNYSSDVKPTAVYTEKKASQSEDMCTKEETNISTSEISGLIDSPRKSDSSDIVQPVVNTEPENNIHDISSTFGISLVDPSKRPDIGRKSNVAKASRPRTDKMKKPSIDKTQKPSIDRAHKKTSIDRTQKPSIDRTKKPSIDKIRKPSIPVDNKEPMSPNEESRPSLERSNSSQDSQVPHPFKEVFDSKLVAPSKKPKRPKAIYPSPRIEVPKDTLALKHEQDRKSPVAIIPKDEDMSGAVVIAAKLSPRDTISMEETPADSPREETPADSDQDRVMDKQMEENILKEQTVIEEPNIKPSGRKSGKTSPRQTKIFDSNNIKKLDREPPLALSPTSNKVFTYRIPSESPVQMSVDVTETTEKPAMMDTTSAPAIRPVKPTRTKTEQNRAKRMAPNNIKTENIPNVNGTGIERIGNSETVKPLTKQVENGDTGTPVSGMSSFLASQLKKTGNTPETGPHLSNGVSPSPVPRKRQAPEIPNGSSTNDVTMVTDKDTPPPLPVSPEPKFTQTNVDDIIKRKKKSVKQTTKLVFDSSKIANKRKDPPKRKPPRKSVQELNEDMPEPIVPRLDLSSLTNDSSNDSSSEYQEGYIPTEIKPCPYKFIGANVKFESSPLKRRRKNKVSLKFDDHAITTFEYQGEEDALESYLHEHPDERAAVEQEQLQQESSSPVLNSPEDLKLDSPRAVDPDAGMKSNTVIGNSSTGALLSYKSKMAVDFQFGVPQSEEDQYVEPDREPEQNHVNDDSLQLLPADESDLDAFSAESSKADMLF